LEESGDAETSTHLGPDFKVKLFRHDHHNVEFKFITRPSTPDSLVQTDLFLFIPKSVNMNAWTKADLVSDLRLRLRLSVPLGQLEKHKSFEDASTIIRNWETLFEQKNIGQWEEKIVDVMERESKILVSLISEKFKRLSDKYSKLLLLIHSVSHCERNMSSQFAEINLDLDMLSQKLMEMRNHISVHLRQHYLIIKTLDEYIAHLYIQFLSSVRDQLNKYLKGSVSKKNSTVFEGQILLQKKLKELEKNEVAYCLQWDLQIFPKTEEELEKYFIKIGHMKKYFQSHMYVDVEKKQSVRKFSEPIAAFSAFSAALATGLMEKTSLHHNLNLGVKGFVLISSGIILYVLKDRLKDLFKNRLAKKMGQILPDSEQSLSVNKNSLGSIREWLWIKESKKVDSQAQEMRKKMCVSELESSIPEDVLHYRKLQKFTLLKRQNDPFINGNQLALQAGLRINLERYLKHLDDPYKEKSLLTLDGSIEKIIFHRAYYFYACCKRTEKILKKSYIPLFKKKEIAINEQDYIYRVVVDKNGISRIEDYLEESDSLNFNI